MNQDWASVLTRAREYASLSVHYRNTDGSPLHTDIPVWMAEFALREVNLALAKVQEPERS